MLVFGTFEHSIELELFLTTLEKHDGISRDHILVVPMDTDPKPHIQLISKSRDLYSKGFEVGMAAATASSVVGTSVGFILQWGPIVWGLLSALIGFTIGFGIYFLAKKSSYRKLPNRLPEITVIVQCDEEKSRIVMENMWKHRVLTVGKAPG